MCAALHADLAPGRQRQLFGHALVVRCHVDLNAVGKHVEIVDDWRLLPVNGAHGEARVGREEELVLSVNGAICAVGEVGVQWG